MSMTIGQPLPRVDGPAKVTGRAKYAAEFRPTGVTHAIAVDSTIAKGTITSIDTSRAETAPGVLLVLTYKNATKIDKPKPDKEMLLVETTMPLQSDTISYAGQRVALVVADTLERAEHAATLITVTYASEKPALSLNDNAAGVFQPKQRMGEPIQFSKGDVDAALTTAPVKIDQTYTTGVENHHPMEPSASVVSFEGDTLVLHESTQGVVSTGATVAKLFNLAPDKVQVLSPYLGGGFGCKGPVWSHTILAVMAALQLKRPVKLVTTRQQMAYSTGHRPATRQGVALGATPDGKLVALRHDALAHDSNVGDYVEGANKPATVLYAAPAIRASHSIVRLDVPQPSFMRAPGEEPGTFALESAMDELAYALKIDPLELRITNQPDKHPIDDKPWSQRSTIDCYRQGAEKFGWSARKLEPRSMREGRELIGLGVASAIYPGERWPGSASAKLMSDGTLLVQSATQDIGTGTYTIGSQIAADAIGLPVSQVRFELGNNKFPKARVSGGSTTAAAVGPAIHQACTQLKQKLCNLAASNEKSALFGVDPGTILVTDGVLTSSSKSGQRVDYRDIVALQDATGLEATAQTGPGAEHKSHATDSTGVHFCEVRVDEVTRRVRVTRWVAVFDVGRILNARTARSQFIGGIVYGLGAALMEHTEYDHRNGWVATEGLADYHVPVNADVPFIDVSWLDKPDPIINELGARGIGEIGTTGVAAAVANAIYHATGKRLRDLPLNPQKMV